MLAGSVAVAPALEPDELELELQAAMPIMKTAATVVAIRRFIGSLPGAMACSTARSLSEVR
jgi:hypothetical protein